MDAETDMDIEELEVAARDATERTAREWHSEADRLLLERGDEEGYEVFPLVQGSVWTGWDEAEGGWAFHYPHFAAAIFEYGTDPHPIEADEADYLAFEWPEMEGVEFGDTGKTFDEVFESSWPTVFFKEIMHPGTEPLRYVRDSARRL